ncbi:MAG TPA: hypothetical protein VEA69_06485 [Tepidisphaeraceae bacterium]|nr:hypothetical protein [Tepidisphaeraceae bacterium]
MTTSEPIAPRPVIPLECPTDPPGAWGRYFVYLTLQFAHRVLAVVVLALVGRLVLGVMSKEFGFTSWLLPAAGLGAAVAALVSLAVALARPVVAGDQRAEARGLAVAGAVMVVICAGWLLLSRVVG